MIDEQSSASGQDYASDRSAIGAAWVLLIVDLHYNAIIGLNTYTITCAKSSNVMLQLRAMLKGFELIEVWRCIT